MSTPLFALPQHGTLHPATPLTVSRTPGLLLSSTHQFPHPPKTGTMPNISFPRLPYRSLGLGDMYGTLEDIQQVRVSLP